MITCPGENDPVHLLSLLLLLVATCHAGDLGGNLGDGRLDGDLLGENSLPFWRELLLSSL